MPYRYNILESVSTKSMNGCVCYYENSCIIFTLHAFLWRGKPKYDVVLMHFWMHTIIPAEVSIHSTMKTPIN